MFQSMPTDDNRTDVLKNLLSKPITTADGPTLIREIANVVIGVSADVVTLMRMVRGDNGADGLLNQVRNIKTDVAYILQEIKEAKGEAQAAEAEAKKAQTAPSTFSKLVSWFADKVLPSLLTTVILIAVGLMFAAYLHLKLVQEIP